MYISTLSNWRSFTVTTSMLAAVGKYILAEFVYEVVCIKSWCQKNLRKKLCVWKFNPNLNVFRSWKSAALSIDETVNYFLNLLRTKFMKYLINVYIWIWYVIHHLEKLLKTSFYSYVYFKSKNWIIDDNNNIKLY